jgi:serine/threonine protein kinase
VGQGDGASLQRVSSSGSLGRIRRDFSNQRFVEWSIPDPDLDLSGATVVGLGGTGKVYSALYQGVPVAVKVLHKHGMEEEEDGPDGGERGEYAATADARETAIAHQDDAGHRRQMVKDMAQEIRVACMLAAECTVQHPNLAVFVGASINELDSLKIVYELVEGGDLVNS